MSHKRVIYFGFGDHRKIIMDDLYEKHQWDPVVIVGSDIEKIQSKNPYTNSVFLHEMELRQAKFDYSRLGEPVPIDAELIGALSKYELNFLGTLEDSTGWNYSFMERRSFYYDMLRYWNTVIHCLNPNLFVCFTWPHTPACYSLYILCKYYYSIDVLFIDTKRFFAGEQQKYNYHVVGNSLEKLFGPFQDLYESDDVIVPTPVVKSYLRKLQSSEAEIPADVLRFLNKSTKKSQQFRLKIFIRLLISTLKSGAGFRKELVAWKKNKKPYYLPDSRMNRFEYFLFVEFLKMKNKKLRKYYKSYCVEPDYKRKYLYFAAPYQPEAVTNTNAGIYDDLFLALDILSSIVPKDWIIYYKENPYIFQDILGKGNLRRDKFYFQRLNAYKNIQLVSTDISTFKLIDKAQVVATVSGTVAMEAAVRGKPALAFGSAWYMGCKSIFWIKTLQDGKDAMGKILNSFTPDQMDIERYFAAIEKTAVKLIHYYYEEEIEKCEDPQYEMEHMAKAFYEAYERYYAQKDLLPIAE